ncbi:MAG: DUF4832 domain-containing protein [Planctomycetia bacterium]|nr:DUF4832 domain-containing protein [Planctomycetia bacterium]
MSLRLSFHVLFSPILTASLTVFLTGTLLFSADSASVSKNFLDTLPKQDSGIICVEPEVVTYAFPNPLKGFRPDANANFKNHPYATVARCYLKWNELENSEEDTIEKIKTACDSAWKKAEAANVRVIPRVYLDWDKKEGNEHWPSDLQTGDYTSEEFQRRLVRLIERLGKCWDKDPRVAWVQMGLIGFWGEHHSPSPTPEVEKLLGETFTKAFPTKRVVVRHADEFTDFEFGIYWDSWAHLQQMNGKKHGGGILTLNETKKRWQVAPIEGETAYNWGNYQVQPGDNPNDTLTDPVHLDYLLDSIRLLHCTALGWIANYDTKNPDVQKGAEAVQKAFGYRYELKSVEIPSQIKMGKKTHIRFTVQNVGSAPFYEKWPIECSLLVPETHEVIWKTTLEEVDIRRWFSGDDWDVEKNVYRIPAKEYMESAEILLTKTDAVPAGRYILALAILDPITGQPAIRFAIENYLSCGRHPLCYVHVEAK